MAEVTIPVNKFRGDRIDSASGKVLAGDYSLDDVLKFSLPARSILRATLISDGTATTLDILGRETDVAESLVLPAAEEDISYFIEYERGSRHTGPIALDITVEN